MTDDPPFVPMWGLAGAHAQTIAGAFWPVAETNVARHSHYVLLNDGDRIVVHEQRPAGWPRGGRIVLLVHGLGGSYASPYMRRIATKLVHEGHLAVSMDLRGAGAGMAHARRAYHGGRSDDIRAVVDYWALAEPDSPLTIIGFSLGANMVLKLLGELGGDDCGRLDSGIAVCPPVDLQAGSERLTCWSNRLYDRHFVQLLRHQLAQRARLRTDVVLPQWSSPPRTLREFDEHFTAPQAGFRSVAEYYELSSAQRVIGQIKRPTWIVASADDPIVPVDSIARLNYPASVHLTITRYGGHLGYLSRPGIDPDRHWLDWRILARLCSFSALQRVDLRASMENHGS